VPSCFSARRAACQRVGEGFRTVAFGALFASGGSGNFTPAPRAFDSPMAIACLADRAPWSSFLACRYSLSCTLSTSILILAPYSSV